MSYFNYKCTPYFMKTQQRKDRRFIKYSWIHDTLAQPDRIMEQDNGRISLWKYIKSQGKVLRVITLSDGRTVHNAYMDRDELRRYHKKYGIQKKNNSNKYYPKKYRYAY